jgi:ribosomal protein S18 acetylase RimI-like enzyme
VVDYFVEAAGSMSRVRKYYNPLYPGGYFINSRGLDMNLPGEKVVGLPVSKIDKASALLSKVFWDDPMTVFLYPDVAERRDLQPSFYKLNIEHAAVGGELYTTSSFRGIAIWRFPGDETRRKVDSGKDPRDRLPDVMGAGPFERLMVIVECTYAMHKDLVKGKHCYLLFLGVEPGRQQQGIGSLLIKPVLERADGGGLPCYLETMKEVNLAFYRKHGFRVADEKQIPGGGPHIWALLRPPGA